MSQYPKTQKEYLKAVARETARMSYPGRMQGKLKAGTKEVVEDYFVKKFPLREVWENADQIALKFDKWHEDCVRKLSRDLKKYLKTDTDRAEAVAAKLLNTFTHQLMKYEPCRPLWKELHLPIDGIMIKALYKLNSPSLDPKIKVILKKHKKCPYSLSYKKEYIPIQNALRHIIADLNKRPGVECNLKSRIELNLLWADRSGVQRKNK